MMDKKDIISKLAGYKLEGDIEGREKTIELGYEIMIRLGMSRHSYFELFLSTFRFIHVHTWIIQLFIFLSGITMALNFKNLQPISEIMLCITGVIFISALFFLDELFKSFTTGMWELEQTFKYDLRQHIMMKLLIFGIIDMVIVILLSLMTKSIVSLLCFHPQYEHFSRLVQESPPYAKNTQKQGSWQYTVYCRYTDPKQDESFQHPKYRAFYIQSWEGLHCQKDFFQSIPNEQLA